MNLKSSDRFEPHRQATSDDVRLALGELDDPMLAGILAITPSLRDLNDAALWWRGDGDLIAREHREMSARALAVAEILSRADEDLIEDGARAP
jgi:hypothetical protein